jgi:hypothetical protein
MGEVLVKPNLNVPNIVVPNINEGNDKKGAESIINTWGVKFPLIEINGYLVPSGSLRNFSLTYSLNNIPKMSFTISDEKYELRRTLKKKNIDIGVIFFGFKDFYMRFNIIVLEIPSDFGGGEISLSAEFYNEKLYNSEQKAYNNLSVSEIIKEICNGTGMGFFNSSNELTSKKITTNINCNYTLIDFINFNVKNFTNSLYSIDCHGYLHLANIETLRSANVDTYIWKNTEKMDSPKDLIISNRIYKTTEDDIETNFKLQTKSYNVSTNIGLQHVENTKKYEIKDEKNITRELKSQNEIGISNNSLNTFNTFLELFNGGSDIYRNILSKDLSGKVVTVQLTEIILEILPFTIINLELYLPKLEGVDSILDEENSGNKIVIGVEYIFESAKEDEKYPNTKQTIFLI